MGLKQNALKGRTSAQIKEKRTQKKINKKRVKEYVYK